MVCSDDFGFSTGKQSCLASSKYMFYTLHQIRSDQTRLCDLNHFQDSEAGLLSFGGEIALLWLLFFNLNFLFYIGV